jgi:hypothetical protein
VNVAREELDRDDLARVAMLGPVDDAHAARTDPLGQHVSVIHDEPDLPVLRWPRRAVGLERSHPTKPYRAGGVCAGLKRLKPRRRRRQDESSMLRITAATTAQSATQIASWCV